MKKNQARVADDGDSDDEHANDVAVDTAGGSALIMYRQCGT